MAFAAATAPETQSRRRALDEKANAFAGETRTLVKGRRGRGFVVILRGRGARRAGRARVAGGCALGVARDLRTGAAAAVGGRRRARGGAAPVPRAAGWSAAPGRRWLRVVGAGAGRLGRRASSRVHASGNSGRPRRPRRQALRAFGGQGLGPPAGAPTAAPARDRSGAPESPWVSRRPQNPGPRGEDALAGRQSFATPTAAREATPRGCPRAGGGGAAGGAAACGAAGRLWRRQHRFGRPARRSGASRPADLRRWPAHQEGGRRWWAHHGQRRAAARVRRSARPSRTPTSFSPTHRHWRRPKKPQGA